MSWRGGCRRAGAGVLLVAGALSALPAAAGTSCPGKIVEPAAAGVCVGGGSAGAPCVHPGDPACDPGGSCQLGVGGRATFYDFNGIGACGLPFANPANALIAAVNEPDYAGSAFCGRCLRVTGPRGTVIVQAVDLCPYAGNEQWCGDSGHLDLSRAAFAAVADPVWGVVAIDWETIACPEVGNLAIAFHADANPWWVATQVRDHRYAVASLELQQGPSWVSLPRTDYNYFLWETPGGDSGPYTFRVTDANHHAVVVSDVSFAPGTSQATAAQLPLCGDLLSDGFESGTLGFWLP